MQRPSQRFRSVQFFIFEIFGRNDSPSYRTLYGDAGRFSFSQNFRNFPFGGKWNTSRRFVPLENSQKKWKILKGEPVFPVGISERNFVFHLHVSRSLYQFQVHGRAPQRTGVYDQMEQLFANRKFHFCCHQNFPFFPKWKAPAIFMPMRMRTPSGTAGNQEKHPLLSFATKA